MQTKSINT